MKRSLFLPSRGSRVPFGHLTVGFLSALGLSLVFRDMGRAQTTTFVKENSTTRQLVDFVLTPNGKLAVVRGHVPSGSPSGGDGIAVFDAATGNRVSYTGCTISSDGLGGAVNPSDFVQTTNSRAILVGGADTNSDGNEDKTYVDVLAFDMSQNPPGVTCLAHHELGNTDLFGQQWAGRVSDVVLTPDQSLAIINSQNWIHVVHMADGSLAGLGFNIGSTPYAGPCTPGFQADSVATTNSRAVVVTTRLVGSPPTQKSVAWVYLIDLLGTDGPLIKLEHQLPDLTPPYDVRDYDPHDLEITPNGALAVVCASDVVGVYDLAQDQFVARHQAPVTGEYRLRFYSETVDSIDVTDTRAIAVAKDQAGLPPNLSHRWTVDVYELPPTSSPAMPPLRSWTLRNDYPQYTYPTDPPHDLAIDHEGEKAVIRTGYFNLVLKDLLTPVATDLVLFNRDPYLCGNGLFTFTSDSVLMIPPFVDSPPGSPLKRLAVTTGRKANASGRPFQAAIDVLDIGVNPPVLAHTFLVTDPQAQPWLIPADLYLGVGRTFVVRCDAPPNDPPPSTGGRDFLRFGYSPFAELARIGASGSINGCVDSIEVRRTIAVSLGERTLPTTQGFVHFVRMN